MIWQRLKLECEITPARSRGPGGQNVNKVSSAALLRWNVFSSTAISADEVRLIALKLSHRMNVAGEVYLRSDEYRDFPRNRERCYEKLLELLTMALHQPKERRATKPTKSSKIKKRETKRRRSETKKMRQRVRLD